MKWEVNSENTRRVILIWLIILTALLLSSPVRAQGGGAPVITLGQIVAVTIIVMITVFEFLGFKPIGISEPIFVGAVTGYIIGIPEVGLVLSGLLELVYLGVYPIGGAAAPNAIVASAVAVFFAKIMGYTTVDPSKLSQLIAFAVPIGILAMYLEVVIARMGCTGYAHWIDREIEKGKIDGIPYMVTLGTFQWAIAYAIPVLAFGLLGASPTAVEAIRSFIQSVTVKRLFDALGVAGAMMPAVGLAYLMKLMFDRRMIPWFILGYVLAAYFNLPILGIALMLIGIILALKAEDIERVFESLSESTSESEGAGKRILTKSDLVKAFLKIAFMSQWAWNYERMQGQAYANIMKDIEKKLRKTKEELVNWMKLHNEFFNTNPVMIPFIVGLNASLEERGADMQTIRSLKTMLMGPLAGLGDGFFWFTWRPIAFGIAASFAIAGNPIAPIIAVILWMAVVFPFAWWTFKIGYRYGEQSLALIQSGRFEIIRNVGTMIAIGIIGALGVIYVNIHTPITIAIAGSNPFKLQDALDKILPRLLPLITILGTYGLYRKGLSPGKVLLIVFVVGFILGLVGFLAT